MSAEHKGGRLFFYDLIQECLQQFRKVLDDLSVAPLHKQLECRASVTCPGALIMEVGGQDKFWGDIGLLRVLGRGPQARELLLPL